MSYLSIYIINIINLMTSEYNGSCPVTLRPRPTRILPLPTHIAAPAHPPATAYLPCMRPCSLTSKVQSKPSFVETPRDANRAEDETYTLNCEADGNPVPSVNILR